MPELLPATPKMPEPPKPSISLDGDHAEPFMDYDVGHTCKISGDFKVVSKSDHDKMGPTIRLEATGPLTPEGKDGAPEGSPAEEASETPAEEAEEQGDEGDEEAILGYKRPTKENKPAPGASAKDLQD